MKKLKHYPGLKMTPIMLDYEGKLCQTSVMPTTTAKSTGQEAPAEINFASSENFNHVWE